MTRQLTSEEAGRLMGIGKFDSKEPGWLWYADPENYRPVLATLRLTENEYRVALAALALTFPQTWAKDTAQRELERAAARTGGFAYFGLSGPVGRWFDHHPLPRLVAGEVVG